MAAELTELKVNGGCALYLLAGPRARWPSQSERQVVYMYLTVVCRDNVFVVISVGSLDRTGMDGWVVFVKKKIFFYEILLDWVMDDWYDE